MTVLITGGTGYIGSHIATLLLEEGNDVLLLDNLSNSSKKVVSAIEFLCESNPDGKVDFYRGDLKYKRDVELVFSENKIDAVIHLASHTKSEESAYEQLDAWENDIAGTINLLKTMMEHNVNKLVYASFYNQSANSHSQKTIIENMLEQFSKENDNLSIAILKCAEVQGTHLSTILGTNFKSCYNSPFFNIFKAFALDEKLVISDVEKNKKIDLIHVVDVAQAFVNAVEFVGENFGFNTFNIGGGTGVSLSEIIEEFEVCCNKSIPIEIDNRGVFNQFSELCDIEETKKTLNWIVKYDLRNICCSTYRWALRNKWKK